MKEPIRVLHVLQRMEAGGTQSLLMNLYRNIDRTKVQFDFLVEYPDKQFYDDEIIKLGGKLYYTNVRNDYNIIKFKKQLKEILKSNLNYKIIHVHAYTIGYFVLKTAKKCGVPIRIAHSHSNSMTKDFKTPIKKILRKLYTRYATNLLACSEAAGRFLYGNKKFDVLNNAIDAKKFSFSKSIRDEVRKKLEINEAFVVGHVGRFKPEKNHEFLLKVFKEIKEMNSNTKLLLVGNGDENSLVLKKIKEYGLNNDVIILKNRNDINELYMAMDVFIFPSLYEGLGIAAVEAQAAGIPCIISDNVPKEVIITPICKQLRLSDGEKTWAKESFKISNSRYRHMNMYSNILNNGYDISKIANNIQIFYIKLYSK